MGLFDKEARMKIKENICNEKYIGKKEKEKECPSNFNEFLEKKASVTVFR